MADIELVIKIPKEEYEEIISSEDCGLHRLTRAVAKGMPLPKGHWIIHPKGIYAHLICDQCLSNAPYDIRTNFCPNCGAKMAESED